MRSINQFQVEDGIPGQVRRLQHPADPRLRRMRAFTGFLDTCIKLPGGYRIGIDPIIGLVPGVGDFISTALSTWLIFEAARLGLPKFVLFRMSCNVALEFLAGAFPILGDIFDAIWKANVRNMRLVEEAYSPNLRPRSVAELIGWYLVILAVLLLGALAMLVLLVWSVMQVIL